MLKKNIKNYLLLLKKNINKKNYIKKSIIQNNSIQLEKIIFFKMNRKQNNNIKISQLTCNNRSIKKKIWINRWEITNLYTTNNLINYKKWTK